jgi:hypothetical protein
MSGGVILTRHEAEERGFVPWQKGLRALGARNRSTLQALRREVSVASVRPLRGTKPEIWWSETELLQRRDERTRRGRYGAVAERWRGVHDGKVEAANAPGMRGHVARLEAAGALFITAAAAQIAELLELPNPPSVDAVRVIPVDVLVSYPGPGHYRHYRAEDIQAAEADLRRWFLREAPGYISVAEAATRAKTSEKWIGEAVRLGRINADRGRRPMMINEASLRAYVDARPTTSPGMRDHLATSGRLTLSLAARRLGTRPDWLRVGWRAGSIEPAEVRKVGRRAFPLFDAVDVDALAAQRPRCECGCGELAWPWWRFVAGHHMRVATHGRYPGALRLAYSRYLASDNQIDQMHWADRGRGLCAKYAKVGGQYDGGQRRSGDGRPVTNATLEFLCDIIAGLGSGQSVGQVAGGLSDAYGHRVTRARVSNAVERLEGDGFQHHCGSCSMFVTEVETPAN